LSIVMRRKFDRLEILIRVPYFRYMYLPPTYSNDPQGTKPCPGWVYEKQVLEQADACRS
jgi:hypothetical protein